MVGTVSERGTRGTRRLNNNAMREGGFKYGKGAKRVIACLAVHGRIYDHDTQTFEGTRTATVQNFSRGYDCGRFWDAEGVVFFAPDQI
eukprot:gene24361-54188_t